MSETAAPAGGAPVQPSAPVANPTQQPAPATTTTTETAPASLIADPAPAAVDPNAPAAVEKPAAEPVKPVEYADFKLPEGIAADGPVVVAFQGAAAKAGMSQDAAQAFLAELAPAYVEALKAPQEAWVKLNADNQALAKADPEFGGPKLAESLATMAKVFDDPRFCDPALRQSLANNGGGNDPVVLRSLYRMAKALTEGGPVGVGSPAGGRAFPEKTLYPNLP